MANELTLTGSLSFTKGRIAAVGMLKSGLQATVAGTAGYVRKTQSVGTSAAALDVGDITTPGFVFIQNNDVTNYVEVLDSVSGVACIRILANEFALFRFTTAAPAVKAHTAACIIEYIVLDS
jgi:hypothetical protein